MIFHCFSQNESVILKTLRRETNEAFMCFTIGEILVDFRSNLGVDSPYLPKSVQNTMATCGQQYRF